MARFKLQIPDRGELLLHDSIEEMFRLSRRDLQYRTQGWAEKKISTVILMTAVVTRTQEKRVERLQTEIEKAGLHLQILSTDAVPGLDVAELTAFHQETLEYLEEGTALLFFNKLERKLVERVLATLLLEIDPSLRPDDSIARVAGRRPRVDHDDFVYKYKSFVDPEWDLRHEVQDWPVDASIELTPEVQAQARPPRPSQKTVQGNHGTAQHAAVPPAKRVQATPVRPRTAQPAAKQPRASRSGSPPRGTPARPGPSGRTKVPFATTFSSAFTSSLFSIRFKLLAAVGSVLICFGGASIVFTYNYFKGENDFLVQWYATGTADSMARRISSELDNLAHTARAIGTDHRPEREEFLLPQPAVRRGLAFAAIVRQHNLGVRFAALGVPAEEAHASFVSSRGIAKFLQKKESDLLAATRGATRILLDDRSDAPAGSALLIMTAPLASTPEHAIVLGVRTEVLFAPPKNARKLSAIFALKEKERLVQIDPRGDGPRLATEASVRKMFGDEPAGILRLFDAAGDEYLTAHRRLAGRPMGVLVSVAARENNALIGDFLAKYLPLVLILFALALLFVFIFARSIIEPIKAMIRALSEYNQSGQTHERLSRHSRDETGRLTHEVRRILALRDAEP